jgi:hypothetical protein
VQHAAAAQLAPAVTHVEVAPHTPLGKHVVFSTPTQWLSAPVQEPPGATKQTSRFGSQSRPAQHAGLPPEWQP